MSFAYKYVALYNLNTFVTLTHLLPLILKTAKAFM